MIYTLDDIRRLVVEVAKQYDVVEIKLFGSYFDKVPTSESDVDLVVSYGANCKGLKRISFINDLEKALQKSVDVINIDFAPDFIKEMNLQSKERLIYAK
ncbi:MAG: nucleotidyltransferase domain-containing protein [Clostridia bacterium]|nr:nucleotidyltransferase domain-containing protein [Clostridia bacterium]